MALNLHLENTKPHAAFITSKRYIIVTTHRRENFGESLENICNAIITLSQRFTDMEFLLPVHPNPNVNNIVTKLLSTRKRIHLLPPLKYDECLR